jgi:hypothetical protein
VHYACEQHREFSKLIGKTGKVREWIRFSKCKGRCIFPCHLAVLMMSLSKQLLNFALIAYVIGLGVYLGSLWQNQLDTAAGHNDSRNIFIVFLISVSLGLSVSLFARVKNMDWKEKAIPLGKNKEIFDAGLYGIQQTISIALKGGNPQRGPAILNSGYSTVTVFSDS